MPTLFEHYGIDPDDAKWYHLSACNGMNINWFYDNYESDKELAKQVDQICLGCPVIQICHKEGVSGKEKGVWGGIYMDLGKTDKVNNLHKDTETWKQLKKLHGKNIL